jgi:predicted component of type VI protein secretion system
MLPAIILVKRVRSEIARETFSPEALEEAAQAILVAGGLICPLVVEREGLQDYKVLDGHFQYWAAVRAREINPRAGEKVNAWILEEGNRQGVEAQLRLFRQPVATVPVTEPVTEPAPQPVPEPVTEPVAKKPAAKKAKAKAAKPATKKSPTLAEIRATVRQIWGTESTDEIKKRARAFKLIPKGANMRRKEIWIAILNGLDCGKLPVAA